jgi:hypothetical protein
MIERSYFSLLRRNHVKWLVPAILLAAVSSFADDGPAVLKLKNGVTFPHRAHQGYMKSDCRQCHRKEVGSGHIPGFGKEAAHRMCRTCHAIKQAGPAACKDCHKK